MTIRVSIRNTNSYSN